VIVLKKNAINRFVEFIKRQPRPFKVNMLRASGNAFLSNLTDQFRSIYILRLGAEAFQLGLVNSIAGIASAAIALPAGWLADRRGIRNMFLLATPILALGSLFFAVASDWAVAIPAMFLTMLACQLAGIACPMVCGSYLKNEERATGKQLCDTVTAIPTLVAPIIAATLIMSFGGLNAEGIRPLYFLQAGGFLLVAVFTYKSYFDTLNKQASLHSSSFRKDIRRVFEKGTAAKRWIVYFFLSSSTHVVSMTYLPAFVTEIKHGDEFVIGGMTAASMVLPLLLALLLGRAADTFGRKRVLYLTIPLYCTSIFLLVYAQNTTMLLISGVLQGFFLLSVVTQGAMTAELVPVPFLGKWYGILNLFGGLANISAPILGGFIWSTIGPSYVFFFIIGLEISKLLILWLAVPETLR